MLNEVLTQKFYKHVIKNQRNQLKCNIIAIISFQYVQPQKK